MQNYSDMMKMSTLSLRNFTFQYKNNIYYISALLEVANPPNGLCDMF